MCRACANPGCEGAASKTEPARWSAPAADGLDEAAEDRKLTGSTGFTGSQRCYPTIPLILSEYPSSRWFSDSLEDRGHALPAPDAQTDERVAPAAALEL